MDSITLVMLARRIGTVRRTLDDDDQQVQASINGYMIDLNKQNFQIDDDGTLWITFRDSPSKAITDVLAERRRQISSEGWTEAHDDQHDDRSLAQASACYVQQYIGRAWLIEDKEEDGSDIYQAEDMPDEWPDSWAEEWWKPKSPRRDLVRAAALLIAEIERIDRKGQE